MDETITSFKGFDSALQCRDFQYAVGQTYTHDGEVAACSSGFHACEYPLDVLRYYAPGGSRFAIVEQSGQLARKGDDSKVASSRITIKAEISLGVLIKAAVEYTFARAKPVDKTTPAFSDEERGHASATGYQGAASGLGEHSVALAAGHEGAARARAGAAIVLVNRHPETGAIRHIRAGVAGRDVEPDTWYRLGAAGQFIKVSAPAHLAA